jgi:hypothetical protein
MAVLARRYLLDACVKLGAHYGVTFNDQGRDIRSVGR